MAAGVGGDDAMLLVFRAFTGTRKVEIGGRRYALSCTPLFRLRDERSGHVHECDGSAALLATAMALARRSGAG